MSKEIINITNVEFGKMINAAAANLSANAEKINKLNVFPVPDGDTGTNMSLTMASGAQYERDELKTDIGSLAKSTAKGLLMGARGNSGVILSQIFRGFSQSVEGKTELTARDYADALMNGAKVAYKSVMKPTEGTILTVIRESAAAANNAAKESTDVVVVAHAAYEASQKALARTPDLLPILKEVGVVDSGGQGLVFVLQAFSKVLDGTFDENNLEAPDNTTLNQMVEDLHAGAQANENLNVEDIVYGYCTEIMVQIGKGTTFTKTFDYDTFYNALAEVGDSLLVINDDEVVKVHIHTENPGYVLQLGTDYGSLVKVKVDNMRDQQQEVIDKQRQEENLGKKEKPEENAKKINTAVIAIAAGAGIVDLLKSIGVTHVIEGGQTMNPSTADIVEMIKAANAEKAIVLPNNSNIFMAAEQAVELADIPVGVVKTRSIQQAMAAMMSYNPEADLEDNVEAMEDALSEVKSGQVTQAVRDTSLNGVDINKGDFIGIVDGDIKITGDNLNDTAFEMVKEMLDDSELVTILYGDGAKEKDALKLSKLIEEYDDELEIEIHAGGQPLYPFLVSVE